MNHKEYKEMRDKFEAGEPMDLPVGTWIDYLLYDKVNSKEFFDLMDGHLDLQKRFDKLETYVRGHMALIDEFQITQFGA